MHCLSADFDNKFRKKQGTKTMIKIILAILFINQLLIAQTNNLNYRFPKQFDKCGFDENKELVIESTDNWGYSYDSLLVDLNKWRLNPYIKIDSIGLSVQGRPLWQLTISSNPYNIENKRTIYIHARTHPQETESFWVTREIINLITAETNLGQTVRSHCVVYIIPMFNPDGVQLNRPRNNANNVDLESNWFTFPNQPEVAALKSRFLQLMNSPRPIEIELNMHSSSRCRRYFVYHDSAGTSPEFAIMQQNYIAGIRAYFPNGIQPWNYFISWTTGTPLKYPECWFWINYGASVMALTYEDMYRCTATGKFDSTANALIRGVLDYMNIPLYADEQPIYLSEFNLYQNYPNPFNSSTVISWQSPIAANTKVKIYDLLGNEIALLVDEFRQAGLNKVDFDAKGLSSGIFFYKVIAGNYSATKKMILLR